MIPPARPQITRAEALRRLGSVPLPALLGIRGYYLSMGRPGENDRGIYDDAIILLSDHVIAAFNANVDPSIHRAGIATLAPGLWRYKLGIHGLNRAPSQRYQALVQAAPVTVLRDGGRTESGWFGINIHRGGRTTTSSLGCQTVPPDQWEAFISLVRSEMKRAGTNQISYRLR